MMFSHGYRFLTLPRSYRVVQILSFQVEKSAMHFELRMKVERLNIHEFLIFRCNVKDEVNEIKIFVVENSSAHS